MRVGLFVPCYIDQLYPDVAVATVELLEQLGVEVDFPTDQTCCGQPMANTGFTADSAPLAKRFVEIFSAFDYIVCPSGSCTAMVRHHYGEYFDVGDAASQRVRLGTLELCEFLHDIIGVERLPARFPHRVGLHQSCHGLRELRLGQGSERMCQGPPQDKVADLLRLVDGLQLVAPRRADECCGFGGTFAVAEADVSAAMGRDRITDFRDSRAEVIVASDMSCLMHLDGLIRRDATPLRVMHVAQVLVGRPLPAA